MRRDPAAAVMRRGSAALHRQGRLIEIELLELVALSLVIGSLAEIDEWAQLGPRQVHEVGIAPAPLRSFPGGPPGFDVLLELEHDFSRQGLAEVNRPVSATSASLGRLKGKALGAPAFGRPGSALIRSRPD